MADDDSRRRLSRRAVLIGAAGAGATGVAGALSSDGESGRLFGGNMALQQAYNVSGDLWIGPDSAKGNVAAESGRVYVAADTQVEYYGDGGSWIKMGVGSAQEAVPAVHTEDVDITQAVDDGTDRLVIIDSAGTERLEIYSNGTDALISQINGNINFDGSQLNNINQIGTGNNTIILNDALQARGGINFFDNDAQNVNVTRHNPQDVRNISSPSQGWEAYHDGSGSNTEGPAFYNGSNWISQVDGSTIS